MQTAAAAQPAAGWYLDPERPEILRFWNGSAWTEHRIPAPALSPATPGVVHRVAVQQGIWFRDWSAQTWIRILVYGTLVLIVASIIGYGAHEDGVRARESGERWCQAFGGPDCY